MGIFDKVTERLLGGDKAPAEMKDASDQSLDTQNLATFIKSRVEESRSNSNRVSHEGVWMTNIAYVLGYDSVYYDTATRSFRPSDRASGPLRRNRLHSNEILPAMQNRAARLVKTPPRFEVRPNSPNEEDRDAARLGQEVLTMLWEKTEINLKRIELIMWLQQCGHAYLKCTWDPELGEELIDPETGEGTGEFEGDVRVDVVPAFEVYPDPLATTLDDCTWVAHLKIRKLEYFRDRYGDLGKLVKEEGAWSQSIQYELRINSLNAAGPTLSGTTTQMKNAAIEIAYYEKRSKKYPRGRMVIVANGIVLENKKLPVGRFPLVKFDDIVIGGKYFSEACVTHARPLQDQYNRTLQKRAAWVNKLLVGKYLAAKGHGLIDEAINDQSAEVVEYDPVPNASPPTQMQIPILPQYAYTESNDLKISIADKFGLSDISQGKIPSAGIPAKGMELLLEQDQTRMGIEVEQHEHAFAKLGGLMLRQAGAHYKTERKLKTKGKNLEYQIKEFKGDDLKRSYDVMVVRGSTVPTSKFLRVQEVLNAYSQGLLGSPQDPAVREKVLGMIEFGDVGEIYKDHSLTMAQIKRDLEQIEAGIAPDVNELDNHPLHVLEKNRYRLSEKFLNLDVIRQTLLITDINAHLDEFAKLQNPQLQQLDPETVSNIMGPPGVAQNAQMPDNTRMGMGETNGPAAG